MATDREEHGMPIDRRTFLSVAGLSALALAGPPALAALVRGGEGEGRAGPAGATRWAMVIDPRKCQREQGCTDCIPACARVHNVPHLTQGAHEVKWIWKEPFDKAFPDQASLYTAEAFKATPVLVFCNQCDNPPCVRVCPTQATWRRADGIVMMDWHRCIGCRYCVAGCPYGSRSFNWVDPRPHVTALNPNFPTRTKGVVEKCNFCEERLAKGQPPACVEACKEKALTFGNLADPTSEVRELLRSRYAIRRRPELGTQPQIYYLV
jgi:molybdopterin-containing oxidoreductase family iron-sulfur binding subunit